MGPERVLACDLVACRSNVLHLHVNLLALSVSLALARPGFNGLPLEIWRMPETHEGNTETPAYKIQPRLYLQQ